MLVGFECWFGTRTKYGDDKGQRAHCVGFLVECLGLRLLRNLNFQKGDS